jgi:hypothetical protein
MEEVYSDFFYIDNERYIYVGNHSHIQGKIGRLAVARLTCDKSGLLFFVFDCEEGYYEGHYKVFRENLEKLDQEDLENMKVTVDLRRFTD